jgi:uncharacterized protein (TIGR02145 family)
LPTGEGGSPTNEFQDLNNAVNSGSTNSDSGLRTTWLAQYSGVHFDRPFYNDNFFDQGSYGYYWSSTQNPSYYFNAWILAFSSSVVVTNAGTGNNYTKDYGFAVRCLQ